MKTRLVAIVLWSTLGATSWGAQAELAFNTLGPGESLEYAWFLVPTPANEEAEDACEGVEFDITFSAVYGSTMPETHHISLSVDEPLAEVVVTGFGKFVLAERKDVKKRGACNVLSSGRLATADGVTISGGNFQIHPPNSGHPYD